MILFLRNLATASIACLLASTPKLAAACSVCGAASSEETRNAFILTTIFLSVLPLGMVGGMAYWLMRRARAQAADALPVRGPAAISPLSRAASSR